MDRKSIFITGAASGIGEATARYFHNKGWFVGCYDVSADGLSKLKEDLGDACHTSVLDVRDRQAVADAMDAFGEITGQRLDIVFNNAGIAVGGFFDEVPFERLKDIIDVNLMGVLHTIYAAIPLLKQTDNSLCFTTSSSAATYGSPGLAVYAATKFAVKGLTEALSVELARHGVRAADVLPGIIDTAIWKSERYAEGEVVDTFEDVPVTNAGRNDATRTMGSVEVAECVWRAYQSDQLHWYVPPEVADADKQKAISPEAMRDAMIAAQPQ